MIFVVASIEVKDGQRDAFVKHFKELVPDVKAEDGCIDYGPTVDVEGTGIDRQVPVRGNVVTVVEKWESLEHLKAHLVAPHMGVFREKVKDLVVGAKLQVLQPA